MHHYKFEWFKNGDTRIESSQNLIEYQEKLSKPPGLVLTLGKIEVNIFVFGHPDPDSYKDMLLF